MKTDNLLPRWDYPYPEKSKTDLITPVYRFRENGAIKYLVYNHNKGTILEILKEDADNYTLPQEMSFDDTRAIEPNLDLKMLLLYNWGIHRGVLLLGVSTCQVQ